MWYLTVVYLELTGNCYWYAAPLTVGESRLSVPGELWLVPTPWVRVVPDSQRYVRAYEISAAGAAPELFSPDEIIHLKYPNPLDPHYGLSPLAGERPDRGREHRIATSRAIRRSTPASGPASSCRPIRR